MTKIVFLHGLVGSKNNFEYLKKEFVDYSTISFDLIGFGGEAKPKIDYALNDFMKFLDEKLKLSEGNDTQYVLVGHSLGALLAKEIAIRYPNKVQKLFLMGYPFLEGKDVLVGRGRFDGLYVEGAWWTKLLCEMRSIFRILVTPFVFLFGYKYRKSWLDYFRHTYQSAYGTTHNTVLKDNKENLYQLTDKIVFINGMKDAGADLKFASKFKQYIIESMGHRFFGFESEVAKIIKDEIRL